MPSDWFIPMIAAALGSIGSAIGGGAAAAAPAAAATGAATGAAGLGAGAAGAATAAPALAGAAGAAPALASTGAGVGAGAGGGLLSSLAGGGAGATTTPMAMGVGGTGAGTGAGVGPMLPSTPAPAMGELLQPAFSTGAPPVTTPYAAPGAAPGGFHMPTSLGDAGGMLQGFAKQGAQFLMDPTATNGPLGQFTKQLSPESRAMLNTILTQRGQRRTSQLRTQLGQRFFGSPNDSAGY